MRHKLTEFGLRETSPHTSEYVNNTDEGLANGFRCENKTRNMQMMVTTYTNSAIEDTIKEFLMIFDGAKYLKMIDANEKKNTIYEIKHIDLFDFDEQNSSMDDESKTKKPKLIPLVTEKPQTFVESTEKAIRSIIAEKQGSEYANQLDLQVIIDDSYYEINVNEAIRHRYRNKLVKIRTSVNGESDILTRILRAIYYCPDGHVTAVIPPKGKPVRNPSKCSEPKCNHRELELNQEESETESYRRFYLIDPDRTERPDTLIAEAKGSFINSIHITDNIEVIGYITFETTSRGVYNVLHILNAKKIEEISYEVSDSDKQKLHNMTEEEGYVTKMVRSIAPNIANNELVKTAFALGYVGGSRWDDFQRYWIHCFIVGDPAQAKTQVAEWGSKRLPHVKVKTVGASAKGLFAGQKEQVDGNKVLEVGDMIKLDDKGLVCIDEFLDMDDVYSMLKYPMESGNFPSDTVGGKADLKCRTPIFATANPYNKGLWNPNKTLQENLHIVNYALLSRFDLIIIVRSQKSINEHKKVAEKILGMKKEGLSVYPEEDTAKLLIYAKQFRPRLTDTVKQEIVNTIGKIFEAKARQIIDKSELDLGEINERLTGTLVRLTTAYSKLHLRDYATVDDVVLARQLIEKMFNQRGFKIGSGQTHTEKMGELIFDILKRNKGVPMDDSEIIDKLMSNYVDEHSTDIQALFESGDVKKDMTKRGNNKTWRTIMEYVEGSDFVEIHKEKHPRQIRWVDNGDSGQTSLP